MIEKDYQLNLSSKYMYPAVKEVKPGIDYKLMLTFDNGQKRKFDMKPYLDIGIFRELKDISKFNTVHISLERGMG